MKQTISRPESVLSQYKNAFIAISYKISYYHVTKYPKVLLKTFFLILTISFTVISGVLATLGFVVKETILLVTKH